MAQTTTTRKLTKKMLENQARKIELNDKIAQLVKEEKSAHQISEILNCSETYVFLMFFN